MNNLKDRISALFKKEGSKSVVSSLAAIGMGLLFGLLIIVIANPSDALSGFKLLLTGGFYRGAKSLGQVFILLFLL